MKNKLGLPNRLRIHPQRPLIFWGTTINSSGKQLLVASSLLVGPGSSPSSVMAKVKSFGDVQRVCPKSRVGFFRLVLRFAVPCTKISTPELSCWKIGSHHWVGLEHLQETIKSPKHIQTCGLQQWFFSLSTISGICQITTVLLINSRVFSFTNHGYRTIGTSQICLF